MIDTPAYITEFSDEDLTAELNRRKEVKENQERARRNERVQWAIKNRDILLEMIHHDRNSCDAYDNTGFHPEHGQALCSRCALEALNGDEDIDIEVEVTLRLSQP